MQQKSESPTFLNVLPPPLPATQNVWVLVMTFSSSKTRLWLAERARFRGSHGGAPETGFKANLPRAPESCARSYLRVVSDWSRQSLQMEAPVHSTRTGKQCKPPLFVASRQRSRALPVLLDGVKVTHARAATRVCVGGHMSAAVAALGSWREEGATVVVQFPD